MVKAFLIDLSHLRFGVLRSIEDMPNVDGMKIIKYTPVNSLFTKEITNVPEPAIKTYTKEEVGGLADAEKVVIVWYGEGGKSPFLSRIQEMISTLSSELERMKRTREIEIGAMKAKEFQYTQDLLTKTKEIEELRKIMERKRERPFVARLGGEE